MMDKAREKTEKKLNDMEREIGRVYKDSPALLAIEKEYVRYMQMVQKRTEGAYKAYIDEEDEDIKKEKKEVYMSAIRSLTLQSAEYNKLVKKIVGVLAKVNQQALDISNNAMQDIYITNYNQVAAECKRVGIRVNGEE